MQHKLFFLLLAVLLLFLIPVAAAQESITIASPSDLFTITDNDDLTVDVTTSNSSMGVPYFQCTNDPGTWTPFFPVDNNRFLKYFDTTSLEDGEYTLSVKTTLEGQDYYDSITINVERTEAVQEAEDTELSTISITGLANNNLYYSNESLWLTITDKETGAPINNPQVSIYRDMTTTENRFIGTSSGIVKVQWLHFDGNTLSPDEYLMSISSEGYDQVDQIIVVKNPAVVKEDVAAIVEKGEFDIDNIDLRIVVGGTSSVLVTDKDTDEPIKGVSIKIKQQSSGTVLRTQTTDEFGRVPIIWDITDTYTLGFSHPDYKSDSFTIVVTPPIVPKTTASEVQEQTPEVIEKEVVRDPTQEEIQKFIEDTNVLGDQVIVTQEQIDEYKQEGRDEVTNAEDQEPIAQPVSASFGPYIPWILAILLLLSAIFVISKYFTDPHFNESINKALATVFKTKPSTGNSSFMESEEANTPGTVNIFAAPEESNHMDIPVYETPVEPTPEPEEVIEESDLEVNPQPNMNFIPPETQLKYLAESLNEIRPDQKDKLDEVFRSMAQVINPASDSDADTFIVVKHIIEVVSQTIEKTTNDVERMSLSAILEDFKINAMDEVSSFIGVSSDVNNGGVEAGI